MLPDCCHDNVLVSLEGLASMLQSSPILPDCFQNKILLTLECQRYKFERTAMILDGC